MMKTLRLYIPLLIAALLFSVSCEKYLLAPDPTNDPVSNFEYLWQELNNKYTYFEYKSVDWDSIHTVYRPQVHDAMSDRELFDLLAAMLYELRDGHVNITSPFDRSRNWSWYLDFPQNFNETILYRNYLGSDYRITGPLHNQIIDSVLYVYYASFANRISGANLDALMDRAEGLKGVIIDIRNNGGGSSGNAYALASCFSDSSWTYGKNRVKTGPGPDDFSPWNTLSINPRSGKRFSGEVVLLCNRNSYSASNLFAQMLKALPNVTLMGDDTGGGAGIPAFGELPNGWIYRFSATQTIDPQGEHIEHGVSVDIRVDLDPADEAQGIDSMLETALDLFRL
ncbi:MAG: S41 family peptidase [FCB group bacterium]|nr:S41 family peptidase [FCB group bacterium]